MNKKIFTFIILISTLVFLLVVLFYWNLPPDAAQRHLIIFRYRIPRLLTVMLSGAALTLGGIQFQAILRNPLADPFILGISSGAALGKVAGILFIPVLLSFSFISYFGVSAAEYIFALLGALLSVIIVYVVALRWRRISAGGVLLSGIVVNAFFGSGLIFFIQLADPVKFIGIKSWLSGRIPLLSYSNIFVLALIIFFLSVVAFVNREHYNQISIGDKFAHSQGLNVRAFRIKVFLQVSLLIAPIVAHTGVIGFVGLILPHILRLGGFANHRLLIPLGIAGGALYLALADFLVHFIQPSEQIFTIGAFTAVLGAPVFLYLLASGLRKGR